MEFQIERANKQWSISLIGGNLLLTVMLVGLVTSPGTTLTELDYVDLLLKTGSTLVAFLLFAASALVSVPGVKMPALLGGLFIYQQGALLELLDEFVLLSADGFQALSTTSDALLLLGQITLAIVAVHFVGLTSRIANTDRLTGLQNRSFHHHWITHYLQRSQHPLAIIAVDLDAFKSINDKHGHDFGDSVLRHVGQLLKQFIRDHRGIVSRTGGEEFELALKRSTETTALKAAEALRTYIEQNPPSGIERLTASIGVAISQEDESATTLRKRADAAAYFSKQSGRNRVSLAGANQTLSGINSH